MQDRWETRTTEEFWLTMDSIGLTSPERLTLLALKHFATEGGSGVRPGQARLHQMTGLGRRTLQRAVAGLETKGVLEAFRLGRGRTNIYRLTSAFLALVAKTNRRQSGASSKPTSARAALVSENRRQSGASFEFQNGTTSARAAHDQLRLKSVCVNSSGSRNEEPTSPPTHTSISDLIRKDQEAHAEVLGIRCPAKIPTGDDLERCVQALAQFTGEERGWIHLGHREQTKNKRRFRSYPNAYPRRRGVDRVELDTAWCMDRVELGRQIAEASAAEKKARGVELADQAERDATSEERCRVGRARAREAREQLAGRKKS